MPADILVHHLNASRSERIFWALEELGLDYKVKAWKRTSESKAPPDLKQIHPLGKAPILILDGKTIIESAFIIESIIQSTHETRTVIDEEDSYWSHFAEGSLMAFLQMSRVIKEASTQAPFYARTVTNAFVAGVHEKYIDIEIQKLFDWVEAGLAKSASQWFGGKQEPSMGDYMMLFPIHAMVNNPKRSEGIHLGTKTKAWLKAVEARPAYQKGLKRQQAEESA